MLIQDFYRVESLSLLETGIIATVSLNTNHKVYSGHFPDQPVVPGVIQLQIVKEILEEGLQTQLLLKVVNSVKFLVPIIPNQVPVFEISIEYQKIVDNQIQINTVISNNELVFTKMKALYNLKTS